MFNFVRFYLTLISIPFHTYVAVLVNQPDRSLIWNIFFCSLCVDAFFSVDVRLAVSFLRVFVFFRWSINMLFMIVWYENECGSRIVSCCVFRESWWWLALAHLFMQIYFSSDVNRKFMLTHKLFVAVSQPWLFQNGRSRQLDRLFRQDTNFTNEILAFISKYRLMHRLDFFVSTFNVHPSVSTMCAVFVWFGVHQ